jgi:LCP family protein required for cell wall assembly
MIGDSRKKGFISKMSVLKKTIAAFTAFIFLLISSAFIFYLFAGGSLKKQRSNPQPAVSENGKTEEQEEIHNYPNKVNILVLGLDERPGDAARSDTMFVIMLDTKTKHASILSIPRDTRTRVQGLGWDKINHAYAFGGIDLAKQATEGLLNISFDYYATINFDGFHKIIDSLGGLTIDVEQRMYYVDPYDDLIINLHPGVQKLDGKKALHYVRYRDWDGDIGRIERQQKFMKAVAKQAATPATLARLPNIIREGMASIETDMTISDTIGLVKILREASEKGLQTEMISGTPVLIDDIDYWVPDIMSLHRYISGVQGAPSDLAAARAQARRYYASIPARAEFDEIPYWLTEGGYAVPAPVRASAPAPAIKEDISAKKEMIKENKDALKTDVSKDADKSKQESSPALAPLPKPIALEKPTETKKPVEQKKPDPPVAVSLRVNIVNASGSSDAAQKMADTMSRHGFEIAGISSADPPSANTIVIAYSSDNGTRGRLSSLPFRHALRINNDASRANQVTIIIGRDYL